MRQTQTTQHFHFWLLQTVRGEHWTCGYQSSSSLLHFWSLPKQLICKTVMSEESSVLTVIYDSLLKEISNLNFL